MVAAGALVIMLVPALSTVTPGTARARRGRQSAISGVARAGADVALILLAVLAGWQLRHYSAVSAGANGNFGLDPVVVIAPALALAGGTVAALRLLPAGGRAGDRLAARGRRLTAALASWQISRQPIRQGGAALLIVLAVATGTLALAQRQSWTRSDHDQAAFSSGADVRVETSEPLSAAQAAGLIRVPGVRHAMPVAIFPQNATHGETLAVDARQAADVTLLRADQSPLPLARLFGKIVPTTPAPGVVLPGHVAEVQLTARLGPASLGLAPALVSVSVEDADGNVYPLDAGSLPADGRNHTLAVTLANQAAGAGSSGPAPSARGAVYPLRLVAVTLDYTLPAVRPRGLAVFTLAGVSGGPGTAQVPGAVLRGWTTVASSAELAGVRQVGGTSGPSGLPAVTARAARGTALAVALNPGYGLAAGPYPGVPPSPIAGQLAVTGTSPVTALPGLATQRFLAASNASVGSTVQTDIDGMTMNVKIVAAVATFPTVSASGGALIVDLGRVQDILTSSSVEAAPVTQWWLATPASSGGGPRPGRRPAPRLRHHEHDRGGGGLAERSAVDGPAAGAAGRRRRRRRARHHWLLREHRGRRSPASRGKRAAGRARRPAAGSGRPALPGKAHAEPAVGAGRPGAGRGARRTAGPRHYPHRIRDHADAAGAHPVQLVPDPAAGPSGRRAARADGRRHHRPAARRRRRTARHGVGVSEPKGRGCLA